METKRPWRDPLLWELNNENVRGGANCAVSEGGHVTSSRPDLTFMNPGAFPCGFPTSGFVGPAARGGAATS